MHRLISLIVLFAVVLPLGPTAIAQDAATPSASAIGATMTVIANGLDSPRGFSWAPDGTLYLALAGRGGETHLPVIPGYTIDVGLTSSVVSVANGCTTPLAQGLASVLWEEPGWLWGAMDVAALNDQLYVLLSGAGPTWGSPSARSGVYRINADGTMPLVADISSWLPGHPPQVAPPEGPSPDGSLFNLAATSDALLVSDAVNGLIIKVTPAGEISTLADLSAQHPVPTGIVVDADGNAYVGFETTPPYKDGSDKVVKIAPDGTISDAWTGLTRVAGLAIGADGTLYAAELSTGNTDEAPFVHANTGRIVHQSGPASSDVIAEGLDFPVDLGFGPDGALYVSGPSNGATAEAGANAGNGWLARVEMGGTSSTASMATTAASTSASTCGAMSTPTAAQTAPDAQAKIADAMSAGPAAVADNATVLDYEMDAEGNFVVLREGSNGWTCFPDTPGTPRDDPMCLDQTWMGWMQAFMANTTPTITVPGVAYMLQGGADASNIDPFATVPAAGEDWVISPPHIMLLLPEGLDQAVYATDPDSGGPWIMFPGTPYEHIMMPVGPGGAIAAAPAS
jgi:hypothetical protein